LIKKYDENGVNAIKKASHFHIRLRSDTKITQTVRYSIIPLEIPSGCDFMRSLKDVPTLCLRFFANEKLKNVVEVADRILRKASYFSTHSFVNDDYLYALLWGDHHLKTHCYC